MRRFVSLLAAGALALPAVLVTGAGAAGAPKDETPVDLLVVLDSSLAAQNAAPGQARSAAVKAAHAQQRALEKSAKDAGIALVTEQSYAYVVNGLSVTVPADEVDDLRALPGVTGVYEPATFEAPEPAVAVDEAILAQGLADAAEIGRENVTVTDLTGVAEAHERGYTGDGITIGIVDSGIAYDHPAFGAGTFPSDRVLGGYDFAENDADPYDDPYDSAGGHGTHVAGIALGDDDQMQGVAPDATMRSYRVFGGSGSTGEDTILAALDMAAADGVDVVNMSLGATGERSGSVLGLAVDQLSASGIAVVVSAGNGFAGPFNASAPGVSDSAIAVGNVYGESMSWLALGLNDGSDEKIPYNLGNKNGPALSEGDFPIAEVADCTPLEPGSLEGTVAVFKYVPGDFTCRGMDMARAAEAAGAVAGLYYNPLVAPDTITSAICCGTATDMPIGLISATSAGRILATEDALVTWGEYYSTPRTASQVGTMSYGSSWGPGNELEFKPDVAAPGENIFSAVPPLQGYYAQKSGTSMAAPHVAGLVALMLQADATLEPATVRDILANTASPMGFTGDPERGEQPTAQQGAGLVNIARALDVIEDGAPVATTSRLAFGDLEDRQGVRHLTVENPTSADVTYTVAHRAAISAEPPYTFSWVPNDAAATVRFSATELVVPAHSTASVDVKVRAPEGVPAGTLLGGWVELTPVGADLQVIRVPYQALAGDFDAVSAINPTFTAINTRLDNPALRPRYFSFGKSEALTVDYTDAVTANDAAWVMVSRGFPMLERYRLQVIDAKDKVVGTAYDASWVGRNSGAGTGMEFLSWDGTLDGEPAPSGVYRLRLVFDKALGDADGAPATETWTSPEVTLVR